MELSPEAKERLHRQLIRLGDMIGDGQHHEPDGKWISREYKKTAQALGILPKRKRDIKGIDERVAEALARTSCPKEDCKGHLSQTRSGSYRVKCSGCNNKYQLASKKSKRG